MGVVDGKTGEREMKETKERWGVENKKKVRWKKRRLNKKEKVRKQELER